MYLPVVGVDVDANVYADVDDDAIPVADMVKMVPQLGQHDPKICYLIHDEDGQLDQLFGFFYDLMHTYTHTERVSERHTHRN